MDCSNYLLEFAQIHVHWVSDVIYGISFPDQPFPDDMVFWVPAAELTSTLLPISPPQQSGALSSIYATKSPKCNLLRKM